MRRAPRWLLTPLKVRTLSAFFSPVLGMLVFFIVLVLASVAVWSKPLTMLSSILSPEIGYTVGLSLLTSFVSASAALLTSIPTAYLLSRHRFPGKTLVETLLMIPFAMPPVALGITLLMFFSSTPLGKLLDTVFHIVFEVPGLVVAQFAVITPIAVKVLKTGFDGVDVRYEGVARTLGYGQLTAIFRIILPMMRGTLAAAFLLGFTRALGEFGASVTLAGATRMKTETLPIALYLVLNKGETGELAALLLISVTVAAVSITALNTLTKGKPIFVG